MATMREDTYRHKGLREGMCAALQAKGISDERVLQAMRNVPRHWFLDMALDNLAYEDRALPIACDQTISQPSTVAAQSQLLDVRPMMKVLEIGTGSGYQTAVLCEMGARVYTIERQKDLFSKAKKMLYDMRYRAKCFLGDGYQGLTEIDLRPLEKVNADPKDKNREIFDRAIITCGAPFIPEPLMAQLKIGGVMVIPVENNGGESPLEMLRIVKHGDSRNEWEISRHGDYRFVPMLNGKQFR